MKAVARQFPVCDFRFVNHTKRAKRRFTEIMYARGKKKEDKRAKDRGVQDIVFQKKRSLQLEDMTTSERKYRQLPEAPTSAPIYNWRFFCALARSLPV